MILTDRFHIAGYCRISVDEELDRDNTSIENQKAILEDFARHKFPDSTLTFYEDRDKSGYTFDQRPGYQSMRKELTSRQKDILLVKDFSRFSRRNSRGLVELEDLRDAGIRIISVGDNIDFPNDDDWLKIQFQFLLNEMPVTDTSKKVKSVIKRRQADGKWICAAPYGYLINTRQEFEIIPTEADVVRRIFALYNDGWGYKRLRITSQTWVSPLPGCPSVSAGKRSVRNPGAKSNPHGALSRSREFWTMISTSVRCAREIHPEKDQWLEVKRSEDAHLVFEHHHQEIVDYRTFAATRALRQKRATSNYRGVKINDNVYSGFLLCGDCGSPCLP